MKKQTIHLPAEKLRRFMEESFQAMGLPPEDARTCGDVLLTADLRGLDTHGISRLGYYWERIKRGVTRPVTEIEVLKDTPATAVLDGHHGMGHVIGVRAMRMAIEKAAEHGLGAVAVRNSTHYGAAGYFADMAVREEMLGLTTTNARPSVVPTFSTEPKYGTNPLAFGAPTDEDFPFLYDASMAVIQRGKIEVKRRAGEALPEGLVIDEAGESLRDPDEVLARLLAGRAAMLPLGGAGEERGGHKGYGLSIMLEILSSALQGGSFLSALAGGDREGKPRTYNLGHFFLAINISSFTEVAAFKKTTGEMMRELRAARPAPGRDRVWTAGEKEWACEKERSVNGIPLSPEMRAEMHALREELGAQKIAWPFPGGGEGTQTEG